MAQGLSIDKFPRHISRVPAAHYTVAMFDQASQARMRDLLHRADLALNANVVSGMKVQLQSDKVARRCAVGPRYPCCLEHGALAAHGNFGVNNVSPAQRGLY